MRIAVKSEKSKERGLAFCLFISLFILIVSPAQTIARQSSAAEGLFSPTVSQKFYEIAYELGNRPDADGLDIEQAIVFLTAARDLDNTTTYTLPEIIKFASKKDDKDHSQLLLLSLDSYINKSADLEVAKSAIQYLLDRLDSREEREGFLQFVLQNISGRNAVLDSQLFTLLGSLKAETADDPNAAMFFMQAYQKNKYNKLAFSKLAELMAEQIDPAIYLEQLRMVLGENPFSLEAAFAFAEYAEQLQLYNVASQAYQYCNELFAYLYPSRPLPQWLYLPWAMSSYNTQRDHYKCLQIAKDIRQTGRFDLFIEAIAAKAAAKIGDTQQAASLLQQAEEKALNLLHTSAAAVKSPVTTDQLAWFYCFVLPDPGKAIDWANKAYSIDPNSTTAAVLAYSFVMNGQNEWAKSLIDNYDKTPISDLALARIQLADGEKEQAFETLKSVIANDPGAFEAETAKEILTDNGGDYVPPIDPGIVLKALTDSLSQPVVPAFIRPEELISLELNFRGSKFYYGGRFGASLVITNNSTEPIVVSDDGLFTGRIRIDAEITGDLNEKLTNLVSTKIQPASTIEPARSLLVPLRLKTKKLRKILFAYPQASLEIEFTAYIDPVINEQGQLLNRLADIQPAKIRIKRPAKKLNPRFLQNQLSTISRGKQGQKTKIARLFAGLLTEQQIMAGAGPLYKFLYADWMPDLLKSALLQCLADDDWVVKVNTMAAMRDLSIEYNMIDAVSKSLNDTHWPARMMAVYLLAKNQGTTFTKVLDYTAQYDTNELVRNMAIALGGVRPEPEKPAAPATPPGNP